MLRLLPDKEDHDDSEFPMHHLARAFDRVRGSRDWKAPIRAEISAVDRPVVEQAVRRFTATLPVFDPVPGNPERLTVSAAGYRNGPWGASAEIGEGGSELEETNAR